MQKIKSLHLLEVPPLGSRITLSEAPELLEIIVTGE
jgi:hypothetical protein